MWTSSRTSTADQTLSHLICDRRAYGDIVQVTKRRNSIDHLVLKDPITAPTKLAHSVSKELIGSEYTQVGLTPPVSFLFSNVLLFHSTSPKPFWQKNTLHKDPVIFPQESKPMVVWCGMTGQQVKAIAASVMLVFKQDPSIPYVIIDDMEICTLIASDYKTLQKEDIFLENREDRVILITQM